MKSGLQLLEQVASIFQGSLMGEEVTQKQEEADTELRSVLAQLYSVGVIAALVAEA